MMAKKKGSIEDLDFTAKSSGGYDPTKGRTHKDNKPFIAHTSIYLQKDIHEAVRRALIGHDKDLSNLVEEYLVEWLKTRA